MHSSILLPLWLLSSMIVSSYADSDTLPNAPYIFNAVESSLRQWGSSLNHNGMSFFLATVPQGVHLHHGSPFESRVQGTEWLAFEAEHAMLFAWKVHECEDPDAIMLEKQWSLKWSFPRYWADRDLLGSDQGKGQQQHVLKPPRRGPSLCVEPGYLHTYATSRPLNLLYIDGQSAGKSTNGTLDSQQYILQYGSPERHFFDDWGRAQDLCQTARTTWQNQIDGFIRMEHGFEMILCDFSNVDVVSILGADQDTPTPLDQTPEEAADWQFNLFSAITSRYFDIGGERVKVHYENFITAYAYPELDLFPNNDTHPRLTSIPNITAARIFDDITSLILTSPSHSPTSLEAINWQSITTLMTTRYTLPLRIFTSSTYSNSTLLHHALSLLYAPYISTTNRNRTLEIRRCSTVFLPFHLHSLPLSQQTLSHRAFLTISTYLCTTLHELLDITSPSPPSLAHPNQPSHTLYPNDVQPILALKSQKPTLSHHQSIIQDLMRYLAWPSLKLCEPPCPLNEICFTAIWPWGTVEDVERPRCRSGEEIAELADGDWGFPGPP